MLTCGTANMMAGFAAGLYASVGGVAVSLWRRVAVAGVVKCEEIILPRRGSLEIRMMGAGRHETGMEGRK